MTLQEDLIAARARWISGFEQIGDPPLCMESEFLRIATELAEENERLRRHAETLTDAVEAAFHPEDSGDADWAWNVVRTYRSEFPRRLHDTQ